MKVLVTGAAGFVGRAVVSALCGAGHAVVALDSMAHDWPMAARRVIGDISDHAVRSAALSDGIDAVVHLATVPGGAAEADPGASRRVNLNASLDLVDEAAGAGNCPRFVFASSIAVFGAPLPAQVDDSTPLAPGMIYGGHKAMVETAIALHSRRRAIDGVVIRLPAVLARPRAPSGMTSAFMSDLFHTLKDGESFECPVSASGTIWAQSLHCCVANIVLALTVDSGAVPETRAVTLPALRLRIDELSGEIARQCGTASSLITYSPDPIIEAAFASQPPLATPAADRAGFAHDGNLATLVASALATL